MIGNKEGVLIVKITEEQQSELFEDLEKLLKKKQNKTNSAAVKPRRLD